MKRVALVFFTRTHERICLPVLRQLEADGWQVSLLPGFDREAQELGESDWEPAVPNLVRLESTALSKQFSPRAPLCGPAVGPLREAWLFHQRQTLEAEGLSDRMQALRAELREWLQAVRPHLVIVPEESDYLRGRLAAQVTQELGLPTLALYPPYYHLHRDYPMSGPLLVQGAIVFTEELAQRLRARGLSSENLWVRRAELPPLRHSLHSQLLFVSQGRAEEAAVLRDLQRAAATGPWQVLVKAHPRRAPQLKDVVVTGESLASLFPNLRAIVALSSAVVLQAYWSGVPVLVAHYGFGPYPLGLPPDGERLQVFSSESELRRSLERLTFLRPLETPFRLKSPLGISTDAGRAF